MFTVIIPYVASEFSTQWHPTTNKGPFARLSRGAFHTEGDAIRWAKRNLNGTPYEVQHFDACSPGPDYCPLCGEDRNHPSQHGNHSC